MSEMDYSEEYRKGFEDGMACGAMCCAEEHGFLVQEWPGVQRQAAIGAWVEQCEVHPERDPKHNMQAVTHPESPDKYFVSAAHAIRRALAAGAPVSGDPT